MVSTPEESSGYWQIDMQEEDREKTALKSHHGLYQFIHMPFSLKSAHGTLQGATDVIISNLR